MKNFDLYKRLQHYDTLDSTNDYALKLIKEYQPGEGTVIMADFQTKGKGQRENSWQSDIKSNITMSIILYPLFLSPEKQFYLSMTLSLAVIELLGDYKITAGIKWPNDIYVNRKKIAGILIENAIMRDQIVNSVLGVGLNVNQQEFSKDIPNATSLKNESNSDFFVEEVVKRFLTVTEKWLIRLYDRDYDFIKHTYEDHILFKNEKMKFKTKAAAFSGTIKGVNESGQLLISDENNAIMPFNYKEIEFCL